MPSSAPCTTCRRSTPRSWRTPTGPASLASSTTSTWGSVSPSTRRRATGRRTLLVPCIKDADTLDFRSFVVAYEDLIRKIHTNKIAPDDFAGTTVTLTNPGTLGTVAVRSPPDARPGRHHRRRRPGLPPRFRGRRPPRAGAARSGQGRDPHVDLRPPHHPGRRIGPVPGTGGRTPHRRRTASTTTSSSPWACLTSRCAGRRTATPARAPRRVTTNACSSRSTSRPSSTCTASAGISSPTSTPSMPSRRTSTRSSIPSPMG